MRLALPAGEWKRKGLRGKAAAMSDARPSAPPAPGRFAAVVLAAGQGTRMASDLHKVLHPIAGRPMLHHLLATLEETGAERVVLVVGAGREQIEASVAGREVALAVQAEQLGTAHAARQAEAALADYDGDVIVLFGDGPLIRGETLAAMLERLHARDAPGLVALAFQPQDALRFGRVIARDGLVERIVEWKDADEAERAVPLCNAGLVAARAADLWRWLAAIDNDNAAGEYYLPDVVKTAAADGRSTALVVGEAWEVAGVNSRAELAALEGDWQARRRLRAMAEGASLQAPDTVWFSHDTVLGRDVTIGPNVVFGPDVQVADGATVHAFSHLEGATVGPGCSVGPFARLRPGAVLERGSRVGNFVEVKKAVLGEGAKANHLTYLGDATVGAGANIGAGTITCNYDGYFKHRTVIGPRAFIGSNSALVAPVTIGEDAIVAAGSAVTTDVADGELRLVRAVQTAKPGWATRFHEAMRRKRLNP